MFQRLVMTTFASLLILKFAQPTKNKTLAKPRRLLSQEGDIRLKYCKKNDFMKAFVLPNRILPKDMSKFMDNHCQEKCRSTAYPYFTQSFTHNGFKTGVFGIKKSDNCWIYYLEARSVKQRKHNVLFHRYLSHKDTNDGIFHSVWKETEADFGDTLLFRLVRIPGGEEKSIKRGYYIDECHKIAYGFTARFYWAKIGLQTDCNKYPDEWNIYTVSGKVCQTFTSQNSNKNIQPFAISKYINSSLSFDKCMLYLRQLAVPIPPSKINFQYAWLAASVVPIFVVAIFLVFTYHLRKRRNSENIKKSSCKFKKVNGNTIEKETTPVTIERVSLPDKISVMILHRPGCEILDNFVRDLSFIIHSYDIHVTSPLLEMSNIDAEGGIGSYIQRNIDICTYVIVVVTQPSKRDKNIEHLHRPFEFSMRILSGLAFRQNEASRYIPVYIEDYKDIISHIPPFLYASKVCGFQVPPKLKELISYMTQAETTKLSKERRDKMEFFVRKLKCQAKIINNVSPHKHCYSTHCSQGVLKDDDASCGWTGASSSCTHNFDSGHYILSQNLEHSEQTDKISSKNATNNIKFDYGDYIVPQNVERKGPNDSSSESATFTRKFDSIIDTLSQNSESCKQPAEFSVESSKCSCNFNSAHYTLSQNLGHSKQLEECSDTSSLFIYPFDSGLYSLPPNSDIYDNEDIIKTKHTCRMNLTIRADEHDMTTQKILAWRSHLWSVKSSEPDSIKIAINDYRDTHLYVQS